MKLNLACRETGGQISVEVDDDKKLLPFFERRIGAEVAADSLGDEFKGYVFKITGGNDKQGFPMLQGVLTNQRVRLLFEPGMKCYRPRRDGQKRRKSVRGCIVSPDLSVINAVLVKKGVGEIAGLTDVQRPRRLGPKRANKIRKMYNLTKDDDVRPFVPRRVIKDKKTKAPKVQRMITATRLQRKRKFKRLVLERRTKNEVALKQYRDTLKAYYSSKRALEIRKKQKKGSFKQPMPGAVNLEQRIDES